VVSKLYLFIWRVNSRRKVCRSPYTNLIRLAKVTRSFRSRTPCVLQAKRREHSELAQGLPARAE
jgi:hypothetical protein